VRAKGFTLIELAVVIVVIGILAGLLLDRVVPLVGRAEKVAFQQMRSQINTALLLEAAERITRGESETLPELAGINPMALMLQPPANYLGSFERPEPSALPRSVWYFDEHDSRLVYRPGRQARFEPRGGPSDRIELTVSFVFRDRDGDGAFNPSADDFGGLHLAAVNDFVWSD
jgi:prepilin-type N-terminal cleavage/methylation domain-containing protein